MKAAAVTTLAGDGVRGFYYQPPAGSDRCLILLLGDEGNDFMSRSFAAWLTRTQQCAALCVAVRQEPGADTGVHCWPIERIRAAAQWLTARGVQKVGILGLSMQAALALTAASLLPELRLVIALSPCDFVPWGFHQGRLGKAKDAEWPSGTSAFSWQGKELLYQPAGLEKEAYWELFQKSTKEHKEPHSIAVFERSEALHPIAEECFIRVEDIRGRLVLLGAEDDAMWDTARYIRRMQARLADRAALPPVVKLFRHGTHFLFPERMVRSAVPLAGDLVSRVFAAGRSYPAECRAARQEVDALLTKILSDW